jgi:hypothetical protein
MAEQHGRGCHIYGVLLLILDDIPHGDGAVCTRCNESLAINE